MTEYMTTASIQIERTGGWKTFRGKDYELRFGHVEVNIPKEHLSDYV